MADPVEVTFQPVAQETKGLTALNTISGLGLVTAGFLWEASAIWDVGESPRNTVWVECSACTNGGC